MQQRQKKQYKELDPFEVIQADESNVAINNGSISIGSSSISFRNCQFKSAAKPQDLMRESDPAKYLPVKKGEIVCLIVRGIDSSLPDVEIKAIKPEDLTKEENKRKVNKIYKLATIRDIDDKSKIMDIENRFLSEVISEVENWPPFTPIIWPVEKTATPTKEGEQENCEVTHDTWKAIFIPGSLYVPTSMNAPIEFMLGGEAMSSFPIQDVKEGDEWWVTYEIDKYWGVKGTPLFTKTSNTPTVVATVPIKPPTDCPTSACDETDGSYALKVMRFEKKLGGLVATMYWRSDITVSGWRRCADGCLSGSSSSNSSSGSSSGSSSSGGSLSSGSSTSDGSVSDGSSTSSLGSSLGSSGSLGSLGGSSSGSDKSTAIVPVNWSPTGYTALFTEESPEVLFHDYITAKITGRLTVIQIDPKYIAVCERNKIWISGICGDRPAKIGAKIIDNKIIITTGYLFKPDSVNITLTGVRRGFLGMRFPTRTKKQFIENEEFLNSAYSK